MEKFATTPVVYVVADFFKKNSCVVTFTNSDVVWCWGYLIK